MAGPPDIIAKVARGWSRDPAGHVAGTHRTGVSAGLWTGHDRAVLEFTADPDPSRHIVSLMLSDFNAECRFDDEVSLSGPHRPGSLNLCHAGKKAHCVITGTFSILHVFLPKELTVDPDRDETLQRVQLINPKGREDVVISKIGRAILSDMRAGTPVSRLRVDVLGLELANRLVRAHSASSGRYCRPPHGGLAPWQLRRVKDHLDEHLTDDTGLDELAALVGLSPFHLCRAFKQSTGLPPHRWRVAQRVARARALLAGTDLPVTDVAAAVGYDDPSYFARLFKREVGVTPGAYRRESRA